MAKEGKISRSYTEASPAHYTLKIESFSQLSEALKKTGVDKYESGVFDVGGYKWKLLMYPYGNTKKNGDGHISLYLAMVETDAVLKGTQVDVTLKLSVYDHIREQYLSIEDGKVKRYHSLKTEHGFDQLLPLATFNDSSNGYLVDDCCVFGVAVHVLKFAASKREKFKIIEEPENGTYTWYIYNFSKLEPKENISRVFTVAGYNWNLSLYPKGVLTEWGRSLSLYLKLDPGSIGSPQKQVYVECKLLARDRWYGKHHERTVQKWFSESKSLWGFASFMLLSDLNNRSTGFLVNDTLVVEAKITKVSVAEAQIS
ncbi:uncharacterized protein LOC105631610 [Jatropha curcas]|uniref:uncharacterized protein LOC105631610 n=1 Tax=Jatropha curcas TaxID=180498 RepID=UPI0005FC224B|nr:uncharacterized protein LOC105631610 [Jatropha curcas]